MAWLFLCSRLSSVWFIHLDISINCHFLVLNVNLLLEIVALTYYSLVFFFSKERCVRSSKTNLTWRNFEVINQLLQLFKKWHDVSFYNGRYLHLDIFRRSTGHCYYHILFLWFKCWSHGPATRPSHQHLSRVTLYWFHLSVVESVLTSLQPCDITSCCGRLTVRKQKLTGRVPLWPPVVFTSPANLAYLETSNYPEFSVGEGDELFLIGSKVTC